MDSCKTTYEALNTQLLEELPKLLTLGTQLYNDVVTEFILLRKLFVGRVTKELLSLMDVSWSKKMTPDQSMSNFNNMVLLTTSFQFSIFSLLSQHTHIVQIYKRRVQYSSLAVA